MSQQRVVSIGRDSQHDETEAVLYEYVFGRAARDEALNQQESRNFEDAHQMVPVRETGTSQAATVGRRLAELGRFTCLPLLTCYHPIMVLLYYCRGKCVLSTRLVSKKSYILLPHF